MNNLSLNRFGCSFIQTMVLRDLKLVFASGLLALAASAGAETKYKLTMKGVPAGEATFDQHLIPTGGKALDLVMTIRDGGSRIVVKTSTTYGPNGDVLQTEEKIFPFGKPAVSDILVKFDGLGATIQDMVATSSPPSKVNISPDLPRANPSTFWFIKTAPKVGEVCTTYIFSPANRKWEKSVFTYEGQTHKGELVRLEKGGQTTETIFDEQGSPISITTPVGMEMVKE